MAPNMGAADRFIRILLAITFAALYFTGTVTGIPGMILLFLTAVFLITSTGRFCPLYKLLSITTRKKNIEVTKNNGN